MWIFSEVGRHIHDQVSESSMQRAARTVHNTRRNSSSSHGRRQGMGSQDHNEKDTQEIGAYVSRSKMHRDKRQADDQYVGRIASSFPVTATILTNQTSLGHQTSPGQRPPYRQRVPESWAMVHAAVTHPPNTLKNWITTKGFDYVPLVPTRSFWRHQIFVFQCIAIKNVNSQFITPPQYATQKLSFHNVSHR